MIIEVGIQEAGRIIGSCRTDAKALFTEREQKWNAERMILSSNA
jgi:hypothetical protein